MNETDLLFKTYVHDKTLRGSEDKADTQLSSADTNETFPEHMRHGKGNAYENKKGN